jgi:hypothetical protein
MSEFGYIHLFGKIFSNVSLSCQKVTYYQLPIDMSNGLVRGSFWYEELIVVNSKMIHIMKHRTMMAAKTIR